MKNISFETNFFVCAIFKHWFHPPLFLHQPGVRIRPPNGKSHWAFFVAGKTRLAEAAERDATRGKGGGEKLTLHIL